MFNFFRKSRNSKASESDGNVSLEMLHTLPDEVIEFLKIRNEVNSADLGINILSEKDCLLASSHLRSIRLARHLGLYVLDDANDSNPFCYITQGIAAGMVIHFNHDPEPEIAFLSLDDFAVFLRDCHQQKRFLWGSETTPPSHPDQKLLAAVISELARFDDDHSESLLCLYIPLLRGAHHELVAELAMNPGMYVREALQNAINSEKLSS
jgi:hypothetical protein